MRGGLLQRRLLPRVKAEIRAYLRDKKGQGGFLQEGLLAFLDKAKSDPIGWGRTSAADELWASIYQEGWRAVHREEQDAEREQRRYEMLDALAAFADAHLRGVKLREAHAILERTRAVAGKEAAWNMRSPGDQAALSDLCEQAEVQEVGTDDADDQPNLFRFTLDNGRRSIDQVIAFPDAAVPGKMRSVLGQFCTAGQYELHTIMSRKHADAADARTSEKEATLAWILDRAAGRRAAVIFNLRDGAPPPPPSAPVTRRRRSKAEVT
jgi:hypothetical protein